MASQARGDSPPDAAKTLAGRRKIPLPMMPLIPSPTQSSRVSRLTALSSIRADRLSMGRSSMGRSSIRRLRRLHQGATRVSPGPPREKADYGRADTLRALAEDARVPVPAAGVALLVVVLDHDLQLAVVEEDAVARVAAVGAHLLEQLLGHMAAAARSAQVAGLAGCARLGYC